ncbi:hypothetical protein [Diplocloster hominis]|uniref:hypothetical protein n=1 Tax=Diplocloster hominis TaxID=3079010 RepID=UPI0031B9F0F2
MPLYEDKHNAENVIRISEESKESAVFGTDKVVAYIADELQAKGTAALDGWYGVDYQAITEKVRLEMERRGTECEFIDASTLYITQEELAKYKQPYVTDDPGFGYVNDSGVISDIMDADKLKALCDKLEQAQKPVMVYGFGAAVPELSGKYQRIFYLDITMQRLELKMWEGELIPFGCTEPPQNYNWKEYHYNDFYLLYRHKKYLFARMDFYVEAFDAKDLKLVPRSAYDEIVKTAVRYPIKQVQIFQPGPWGAYRHKDLWEIEGLEISAWNKMSGPEMSVVIDFGAERTLNFPLINLLQYNREVTGDYMAENYPDLWPLDIWLDDGYFPDQQPAERISMPIHNHPGSRYVKQHFNEPLGRYETYYIAEAYEGANTWMGFKDHCDLEEFENKCFESNNRKSIENWKDYIANWKSNVGDLYLIPPGTAHGHGGNQMVLEMDTSPSIAGTEYSFFQYDFARQSWDDDKKTMTGKPLNMHLEHAFDNEHWRRAGYVQENLRARAEVTLWTKDYWMDKFSSLPEMPFDIERIYFDKRGEYTTSGRHLQMITLTVGHHVTIRSKTNPEICTSIERLQCAAVPAYFGDYEIISEDGCFCTCVIFYMKK